MAKQLIRSENGFTLVTGMLIIALLLTLGTSIMSFVNHCISGSARDLNRIKAFYLAEAGIERAKLELKYKKPNNILLGADGNSGTRDDGILSFGSSVSFGNGIYSVKVTDNNDGDDNLYSDSDGKVVVRSKGIIGDTERIIEILLSIPINYIDTAFLAGDKLKVNNVYATVAGSKGNIHSNSDLAIVAGTIHQNATASGNYYQTGGTVIGESGGGKPVKSIPVINPQAYKFLADYEMRNDGTVYDKNGNYLASNSFGGWEWYGTEWSICDTSDASGYQDGTFYFDSDVSLLGGRGTYANPWNITMIAKGNINSSGNSYMKPKNPDFLVISGGDIILNGTSEMVYTGLVLAHEQVKIMGSCTLNGAIIAEGAGNNSSLVSYNLIGGGQINYSGELSLNLGGTISFSGWHEVFP